jgi:hypothetical protein
MTPQQILALLPHAFQASEEQSDTPTPLTTLLGVMDTMHGPTEAVLERYTELFSASTAPETHYALLGGWLSERYLGSIDATCERELLLELGTLQGLRGTPRSLLLVLRLVTGCASIAFSESARVPFHIAVRVPAALRTHTALISAVLDEYKPAHITYELSFV